VNWYFILLKKDWEQEKTSRQRGNQNTSTGSKRTLCNRVPNDHTDSNVQTTKNQAGRRIGRSTISSKKKRQGYITKRKVGEEVGDQRLRMRKKLVKRTS